MTDQHATVAAEVARLQALTTDELRVEYRKYTGEEPRSRNKQWLFRRTAWAYQASVYGGLSDRAKARLEELAPTAELALRTPKSFNPGEPVARQRTSRDQRIPRPGTALMRTYRGERHVVTVTKAGFEYDGRPYRSLSAVAKEITGSSWNGLLFFGLTQRKPKK